MPINSKKKGNRVELEFAKLLTKRFNQKFTRVPASGAHGTRLAETNIREDAKEILSGDLICPKEFRFSVEVKSRININFWDLLNDNNTEIDEWISQSEGDAKIAKKEMLVIVKINNRKPFIIIDSILDETLLIYKKKYSIIRLDYFLNLPDDFFWNIK